MTSQTSAVLLQEAIEGERKRIAQDLHDGIGQSLTYSKVRVENALVLLRAGRNEEVGVILAEVANQLRECIGDVRHIATELRPAMLDDLGVLVTVRWLARKVQMAHPNIGIQVESNCDEGDVPQDIKLPAFRIIQEAVNNSVKHAQANRICIAIKRLEASLYVHISDDGVGFSPDQFSGGPGCGIGLPSMRDRAKGSKGTFSIYSTQGTGTHIDVQWPLQATEFESNLGLLEGHATHQTEYPPLDLRL